MIELLNKVKIPSLSRFLALNGVYKLSLTSLVNPLKLLIFRAILNEGKKVLFVVPSEQEALKFQKDLENFLNIEAKVFPSQEINFYDDVEKNYYIYKEQINVLLGEFPVVVAPVSSLFEKFPSKNFYKKNSFEIKKGEDVDYQNLINSLLKLGYKRTTSVMDVGEFCVRGDILDIYTLEENPCRIEFFGDTVEDIRFFDPQNQRSFEHVEKIRVLPLYKFLLDEEKREEFKKNLKKEVSKIKDDTILELYSQIAEKVDETGYFEGIEYYQNYFTKELSSPLDFFYDCVLVFDETSQIMAKFENLDKEYIEQYKVEAASGLKLPLCGLNHTKFEEFYSTVKKFKTIGFDNFLDDDFDKIIEFETSLPPIFSSNMEEILKYIKTNLDNGANIVFCTNYQKRVQEILKQSEIFSPNIFFKNSLSFGGGIVEFDGNFEIPNGKFIFLSDRELFNKRSKDVTERKYFKNKQSQDYIDSINDIKEGEFVVHQIHGVGIYNGLVKQEIDGALKDYLEIQFANNDKLFMPAEQINLLYRYRGAGATKPKLSKMGGAAWENTKSRAKAEVEIIAQDLLELYARRQMAKGIAFEPDTTWQYEMEDAFEFTETPDQMKAIIDTKADMENAHPMDRLICADVGFGKTEIAIRAIFKAVMSGKQAALIAPTTILALQHYQTIFERFKPFSVRVDLLSRFRSVKEQKQTVADINEGKVDVVIGTHRLLGDDIQFKNLGLLVIDEEHKFGVRHKEKLKKFRENIDILAMSATPIPRTLNMALSGIKDLSVINTPPKNRLSVKTYVGEFSRNYLKNAINHEIQRDGQVFCLYNRVETIYQYKDFLQEIVPNARIAVAHGQMKEGELERIMYEFANREYDILLCTTIIESGLDISNANTIIINDADRFGLAQLYQLRGRVGRSDRQAYCYCFYKKSKELTQDAFKRLNAIKDFTSLGSGYHIALRDIEIRGVGNILGAKQHGHMVNVGFDTYCNLLEECINELKQNKNKDPYLKEKIEKHANCVIDINVTAYIPDEWVGNYEQKMLEYKRLSDVKNIVELDNVVLGFKDRFSKLPKPVENLIKIIKLRLNAELNGITMIRQTPDNIRIYTPFSEHEWFYLKRKIDFSIIKHFKFTNPPKTVKNAKGILLMNKNELNFDEVFNILTDLFYYISKVVSEFKIQNK